MKKLLVIGLLVIVGLGVQAQQFIKSGKIEFERRTNQHSMLEEDNLWNEMMKE